MSEIPRDGAEQMLFELEDRLGRPLHAMLEVSDRCNEVCVHCYQEQGQKGEMSTAQVKTVMDELAAMGILMLTISGGEATLRHDFIELLEHARSKSFALKLYTNGLTMTAQLAAEMKRLAVQSVEISLYSHRAEVHDFVTGVAGSFERTVAGIRHLQAQGVGVYVKTPIMRVNEGELDEYTAFMRELGVRFGLDPGVLTAREGGDISPLALSRSETTHARLLIDPEVNGRVQSADQPRLTRAARPLDDLLCDAGRSVHVEANGELRPCSSLELPLGHASEGIAAARESNAAIKGLRELRWQNVHGCRDCDLRAYCGRCYALALTEAGDALGPYASACTSARTAYAVSLGVALELAPRTTPSASPSSALAAELGPYRHIEGHRFQAIADVVTSEDDALAARLAWVRTGTVARSSNASASGLVQLRRPGKKPRPVMIPDALKHALSSSDALENTG